MNRPYKIEIRDCETEAVVKTFDYTSARQMIRADAAINRALNERYFTRFVTPDNGGADHG